MNPSPVPPGMVDEQESEALLRPIERRMWRLESRGPRSDCTPVFLFLHPSLFSLFCVCFMRLYFQDSSSFSIVFDRFRILVDRFWKTLAPRLHLCEAATARNKDVFFNIPKRSSKTTFHAQAMWVVVVVCWKS